VASALSCNQNCAFWNGLLFNLTVSIRVDERHSSSLYHAIGQADGAGFGNDNCADWKSNKAVSCRYVVCEGDGKFVSLLFA
jgi:hypothetical protein